MNMFLSLKIENFLSISDEATLNLEAPLHSNHHPDHIYSFRENNFGVLRSIGIYGANASGKSNLLQAFSALSYIIVRSGELKEGDRIPCYSPFKLSKQKNLSPIKFTAEFLVDDVRYIYFVSFNSKEIVEETLDFYPSRVKANVFSRGPHDDWETIKFGGHYKGGVKKVAFFKNNSYLSKAGDNAATPQIARDVYNFFRQGIHRIGFNFGLNILGSTNVETRKGLTEAVSKFLCLIDTGISKISYKEVDASELIKLPESLPQEIKEQILAENSVKFLFEHTNEDGEPVQFEEEEESDGTQRIFKLSPLILSALLTKKVVIFDELDNSLHPHIADLLIKLFNDPEVNRFGSQLIFSTHNMQLMAPEKLRRDQIWLAQKIDSKTTIYSLNDFDKNKVKINTPYAKWYDDGRFGAVPSINYSNVKNFLSFINENSDKETAQEVDEDIFGNVDDLKENLNQD